MDVGPLILMDVALVAGDDAEVPLLGDEEVVPSWLVPQATKGANPARSDKAISKEEDVFRGTQLLRAPVHVFVV